MGGAIAERPGRYKARGVLLLLPDSQRAFCLSVLIPEIIDSSSRLKYTLLLALSCRGMIMSQLLGYAKLTWLNFCERIWCIFNLSNKEGSTVPSICNVKLISEHEDARASCSAVTWVFYHLLDFLLSLIEGWIENFLDVLGGWVLLIQIQSVLGIEKEDLFKLLVDPSTESVLNCGCDLFANHAMAI